MLRLDDVSLARDGRVLLEGVSLAVMGGDIVVLLGERAAGHSTLLRVAAGRQQPDRGSVWIGARDVAALQRSSRPYVRRNIGYAAAGDLALIGDETALENVALALGVRGDPVADAIARAREMLTALALEEACDRSVRALSSDEQLLVAIARALAPRPSVLVLDDPTAGLRGPDEQRLVAALATAAQGGAAVLAATADDGFAQKLIACGARSARLDQGRLVTSRPAISLVRAPRAGIVRPPAADDDAGAPRAARPHGLPGS